MADSSFVLIAVDVQKDFLPGGALAVADGDLVVQPLLEVAAAAHMVVATRDFHPRSHVSFLDRGGSWPEHCVSGTSGAQLDARVDAVADVVMSKGMSEAVDAYSGFDGTALEALLRGVGAERLAVAGLATDYCVRATVFDALRLGFRVNVVRDAVRAVDINVGDGERALAEMCAAGATLQTAAALSAPRLADAVWGHEDVVSAP